MTLPVSSMMQEIHVMKNYYCQLFGARKSCFFYLSVWLLQSHPAFLYQIQSFPCQRSIALFIIQEVRLNSCSPCCSLHLMLMMHEFKSILLHSLYKQLCELYQSVSSLPLPQHPLSSPFPLCQLCLFLHLFISLLLSISLHSPTPLPPSLCNLLCYWVSVSEMNWIQSLY